jgi:hypothetical protein
MGDDLAYRRIEIYRLGGALPELIGTFVVGIPKRAIEDFRAKNRFPNAHFGRRTSKDERVAKSPSGRWEHRAKPSVCEQP